MYASVGKIPSEETPIRDWWAGGATLKEKCLIWYQLAILILPETNKQINNFFEFQVLWICIHMLYRPIVRRQKQDNSKEFYILRIWMILMIGLLRGVKATVQ